MIMNREQIVGRGFIEFLSTNIPTLKRKKLTQKKYFQEVDEFVLNKAAESRSISENLTDETIIETLDDLQEHYRTVILLIDVYEFKYKEVSEILDVPIGTVMSRLHRARAILRASLLDVAREEGIIQ